MSNTISRISHSPHQAPEHQEGAKNRSKEAKLGSDSFKKVMVDPSREVPRFSPISSPARHQMARRRLFGKLVRKVLSEKDHPYKALDGELKQDMIDSITEELVNSHYKI